MFAEQLAVDPPPDPAQVQVHGPEPLTAETVPALQRFAVGAEVKLWPLDDPQAPLTVKFAEQLAVDPPLDPAQVQVHGPEPLIVEIVPALQRFVVGAEVKLWALDDPQAPLTDNILLNTVYFITWAGGVLVQNTYAKPLSLSKVRLKSGNVRLLL